MQKKLTLILILILVLAQLCACGKPQAETSPAAESEAAAPAELPAEDTGGFGRAGRYPEPHTGAGIDLHKIYRRGLC